MKINKLIEKLNKLGGWRARSEISFEIAEIHASFGAASFYEEKRNWEEMLAEIQEGIDSVKKLEKMIKAYSK